MAAAVSLLAAPVVLVVGTTGPAGAASFTVTNNSGSGAGSLRQAFIDASGTSAASNTITINPGVGTITLSALELSYSNATVGSALTIQGNGATVHQTTVGVRVIHDTATGLLTIDGLTITGGNVTGDGGAVLTGGDLTITNSTVSGNSGTKDVIEARNLTISNSTFDSNQNIGASTDGILDTSVTTVTNSTFTNNVVNGLGTDSADAIFDTLATTLTNTTVSNNTNAALGTGTAEGIIWPTDITITNSTITNNTNSSVGGEASGIINSAVTTLTNSSVTGNTNHTGAGRADGIVFPTNLTMVGSTVGNNTSSTGSGNAVGGLFASASNTFVVKDSTVANNATSGTKTAGGGIFQGSINGLSVEAASGKHPGKGGVGAQATGSVTLVYATVVGNTAQTGANIDTPNPLTAFGSVVALGSGGANCKLTAATTSNGWNFSDDASCGFTNTSSGDRQNAGDPILGALTNNGGPAPTRLPGAGSPLIDAIPIASCQADGAAGITTDERGVSRPQGAGCDIGAVEVVPVTALVVTPRFTG